MAFFLRIAVTGAVKSQVGSEPAPPQQPQAHVDTKDLERAKQDFKALAEEMPNVAVRALNKAMTGVKTDMKNIVREHYNYKASTLDSRISISKATRARIEGHIESKGEGVHLTDISPGGPSQTKQGITVSVKKSTGRRLIPRAFKAPGRRSGKEIVFRRPGSPPGQHAMLVPRYGPMPPVLDVFRTAHPEVIYNAPENWARIADAAAKRLDDNIAREIDAEFRRQEGKWG